VLKNTQKAHRGCRADGFAYSATSSWFRETGLVLKKSHLSRILRKLTVGIELMILHTVLRHPGIYLHKVARELNEILGAEIALSTICMFLKKCGFT
jgi:transposase